MELRRNQMPDTQELSGERSPRLRACARVACVAGFLVTLLLPLQVAALTKPEIYRHAKSGTVLIVAIDDKTHSVALGSGFFVNPDGLLITNAHVLEDSTRLVVYVGDQEVYASPNVVAVDADRDLAALRIPVSNATSLTLADQPALEGAEAIAVGYPRLTDVLNLGFDLHPTSVPGIVNGLIPGRSRTTQRYAPFLQTIGLINQGSSGGPLVELSSGQVTGMVVQQVPYLERARDRVGVSIGSVMMRSGIGYAIPAATIARWLDQNGLQAVSGPPASQAISARDEGAPLAARSFATGHFIYLLAQVLPKDPDLYNLAVYHYEAAVAARPHDSKLLRHLGAAYTALGRFDEAIRTIREALDREPESALAAYELGLALEAKGLPADALNTWQDFLGQPSARPDPDGCRDKMREAVNRLRMTTKPVPEPTAVLSSNKDR